MNTYTQTVNQYIEQVQQLESNKKEKTADLYAQIRVIEQSFNSQIRTIENKLQELKNKYIKIAHDLSIEKNSSPCSRWGSYLDPDEINFTSDGIILTWIQSNPYGSDHFDYFEASWEELLDYEATVNLNN